MKSTGQPPVGISYSSAGYDHEWMPNDDDELLRAVRLGEGEVGVDALKGSPILTGLLGGGGEGYDLFASLVLPPLNPTDLALFARASKACQAAVVKSGLPRAGTVNVVESRFIGVMTVQVTPLCLANFVESEALLKWAKAGVRENKKAACRGIHDVKWTLFFPEFKWTLFNSSFWANGCPWGGRVCELAAWTGGMEALKWARAEPQKCAWGEFFFNNAAAGGNIEVMEWARENGAAMEWKVEGRYDVSIGAAHFGQLDALKWWGEWMMATVGDRGLNAMAAFHAAQEDHRDVLQYLLETDAPISVKSCAIAAANGNLSLLQWMRTSPHKFPWDVTTRQAASENGYFEIESWAAENGCPDTLVAVDALSHLTMNPDEQEEQE